MALRWHIGLPGPFSISGRVFPRSRGGSASGAGGTVLLALFMIAVWVSEGPAWVRVLLTVLGVLAVLGALAWALWWWGGDFIGACFQGAVYLATVAVYLAVVRLFLIQHYEVEPMGYEHWLVAHHAYAFLANGGWLLLALQLLVVVTAVPYTAGFISRTIRPLREYRWR